jgi:hypothetical protein
MGALALGTAVGVVSAGYEYTMALDAKEQSEFLELSTFASKDTTRATISQEEYAKYKSAKLSAMISLGLSALDVGLLAKNSLKAGKTLSETTEILEEGARTKNLAPINRLKQASQISEAKDHLSSMRGHLTQADFYNTGQFSPNGKRIFFEEVTEEAKNAPGYGVAKINNQVVEGLESQKVIRLEPAISNKEIGEQIESVVLKNSDGKTLGKIACVKIELVCLKGRDGQDLYNIPVDGNYIVVLKKKNGEEVFMNTAVLKDQADIPRGFRLALDEKTYREKGFYGGHTPDSLNTYLAQYGDRVKVVDDMTQEFSFKFPGHTKEFKVKMVYTSIDGQVAKKPKTIFMGGEQDIQLLESILSEKLAGKFTDDAILSEQVITNSGQQAKLMIPFTGGKVRTIMVSQTMTP